MGVDETWVSTPAFGLTVGQKGATDDPDHDGTDLGIWNPLNITGAPGAGVTIGAASGGLQFITVKIPKSAAGSGGKLFGRLNTTKP